MADSVGKGIALGERFKYDTTSGTAALNQAVRDRNLYNRKKEDEFTSALDFKVDTNKLLPAYGKEAVRIQKSIYDNYARYKAEDKKTAMNRIGNDLYQAKQDLGRLYADNDRAKEYISQKDGMVRDMNLVKTLTSTDSEIGDLKKFHNGYVTNIGDRGEFSYRPIGEFNPSKFVKYEPQDYNTIIGKSKPVGIAGKTQVEKIETVNPEAIARNAVILTQEESFIDNVVIARPELMGLSRKEQIAAAYDEAFKISTQLARAPQSRWEIVDLPNPIGDSSSRDKREKPVIAYNTKQTLLTTADGTETVDKIIDGKLTKVTQPVRNQVEGNIPLSVSVAKTRPTTIPLDARVIDATTNKFVSGNDLNKPVTFKPDNLIVEKIKGTGKFELYVMGTAIVNVEKKGGLTTQKEITYKVPYDKVKSSVEAEYDLTDFKNEYESFRSKNEKVGAASQVATSTKGSGKTVKSSEISGRAKAAGYTDVEYKAKLKELGVSIVD